MTGWDVDHSALSLRGEQTGAAGTSSLGGCARERIAHVFFRAGVGENDELFAGLGVVGPEEEAALFSRKLLAGINWYSQAQVPG